MRVRKSCHRFVNSRAQARGDADVTKLKYLRALRVFIFYAALENTRAFSDNDAHVIASLRWSGTCLAALWS
jgi:hypothetical protein